jgi:hypothetical protein
MVSEEGTICRGKRKKHKNKYILVLYGFHTVVKVGKSNGGVETCLGAWRIVLSSEIRVATAMPRAITGSDMQTKSKAGVQIIANAGSEGPFA